MKPIPQVMVMAVLLAVGRGAAAQPPVEPAADYALLSKASCANYIASYGKSSDPFWLRAWKGVTYRTASAAEPKARDMPATEVLFAVACECRLHEKEIIGAAVDTVIANAARGHMSVIPIGVPRQPPGWARDFDTWIKKKGPRPRWHGLNACDLTR